MAAIAAVYHIVSRMRTELNMVPTPDIRCFSVCVHVRSEDVASPAPGVQEWLGSLGVDLASQAIDVDFDQIRKRIKLFVPDVLGNFGSADDASSIPRKKFHECVFLGSKRDRLSTAQHSLSRSVDNEVGD
jgi:hypothetical protein